MKRKEPRFRQKIQALAGDCMQPGLGLSLANKNELVKNVSVLYLSLAIEHITHVPSSLLTMMMIRRFIRVMMCLAH